MSSSSSDAPTSMDDPFASAGGSWPHRALNARYLAYLDQVFPPRRRALRYGVPLLLFGLAVALLVGGGIAALTYPWAWTLPPLGGLIGLRAVLIASRLRRVARHYARVRRVAARGLPVMGYLVRADRALLVAGGQSREAAADRRAAAAAPAPHGSGASHHCLVLFSFQPEVGGDVTYMRHLARRVARLKKGETLGVPDTLDSQSLAALVTEPPGEKPRRHLLPLTLTDGSLVWCADLWVRRAHLMAPYLAGDALVCLAEAEENGDIEMVPAWLLPSGMDAAPAAASDTAATA